MVPSLRKFDSSEVAQKRMEMICFYDTHGETITKQAFGVDRKVISSPNRTRRPATKAEIVEFIKEQRRQHFRLGKDKLKIFVDRFCLQKGISTISVSTIGNIIKRNKFFFQKAGKTYHDPASKWAQNQVSKKKRLRVKHSPKPIDWGYINSDSVERVIDGIKEYFTRKKTVFPIISSTPGAPKLTLTSSGTTAPFKTSLSIPIWTPYTTKGSLGKSCLNTWGITTPKDPIILWT